MDRGCHYYQKYPQIDGFLQRDPKSDRLLVVSSVEWLKHHLLERPGSKYQQHFPMPSRI